MTDFKNSIEGQKVAAKYSDILHLSHPEPSYRHPRMPVSNRAKIFSPFAALRGYDEEITEEKWKQTPVEKKLLSDDEAGVLSDRLLQVKKGMTITVRYFEEDNLHPASPSLCTHKTISGVVALIEPVFRQLCISDGNTETVIDFDVLDELFGKDIVSIDEFLGLRILSKETTYISSGKSVLKAPSRNGCTSWNFLTTRMIFVRSCFTTFIIPFHNKHTGTNNHSCKNIFA